MLNYGDDKRSALDAKFNAQKIAFAPIMFQAARSLVNLGVLELLMEKRKGLTIENIAKELDINIYGVKVLLEAGLSLEVVLVKDDKWFITKTGYFLQCDDLTRINLNFTHDVNYQGMFHLEDSIKTSKPEGLKVFGNWDTIYAGLFDLPQKVLKSWLDFDHFYSDITYSELLPVVFKNKPAHIMDVGGNTGNFSIQCLRFNPGVKLTIVDHPAQIQKAKENIEKNGFSDRFDAFAADLLDENIPLPKGADLIWMSQFLDCFSQQEILSLLKRARDAMPQHGRLYILETYWDKQRFKASTYSLHATSLYFTCMANGNSQMYHSRDMMKLIENAGLELEESIGEIGVSHTLFICKVKNK